MLLMDKQGHKLYNLPMRVFNYPELTPQSESSRRTGHGHHAQPGCPVCPKKTCCSGRDYEKKTGHRNLGLSFFKQGRSTVLLERP